MPNQKSTTREYLLQVRVTDDGLIDDEKPEAGLEYIPREEIVSQIERTSTAGLSVEVISGPTVKPEIIRVLRVIEYVGPRAKVEDQVARSLHGEKRLPGGLTIKAATIGWYPEVLEGLPIVEGYPGNL